MRIPPEALALIYRQHGLITRRQLLNFMSQHAIDGLVRRGQLIVVQRGVYRASLCPPLSEHAAFAAAFRAGNGAGITGPFALALRGVHGLERTHPWEILLPPGKRLYGVDFPFRRNPLPNQQIQSVRGMPLVSATAALVDSARFVGTIGSRSLRLAYDSSRWQGLTNASLIRRRIHELGPKDPGARLFGLWDERGELDPESDGERKLGQIITRIDPLPLPQVLIGRYRIDWFWKIFRFGYEYQGSVDHSAADNRLADAQRSQDLRLSEGVELRSIFPTDLDHPDRLLQRTIALLTARALELDVPPPRIA